MDIYKIIYMIIGFHLFTSAVLFIIQLPGYSQGGLFTETGTQSAVTQMVGEMRIDSGRVITDSDGTYIHGICDKNNASCTTGLQAKDDTSIVDSLLRYIPGAKYVAKFITFISYIGLAPYRLVLGAIPAAINNIVILALIYFMFIIWHIGIAVGIFNWIFDNRGKPNP